ncbi:MAG TPA: NADH-quinone oxidoreductase subunit M, partial [Candidatus Eremiobacteraeota bacterium]|nr:NADH-quinone oxidoreductase subunit M [Candidatus Eremiobacteraeota bacterium]
MLTAITFIPLLGALLILCINKNSHQRIKDIALWSSGVSLLLSLLIYPTGYVFPVYSGEAYKMFMTEGPVEWIRFGGIGEQVFTIHYFLGVDGISLPLVILTTLLTFLSILYSGKFIKTRIKEYFFLFLLLETGMVGVFVALDFFLFYVFWEICLVPMYFLIGIWGGPKKEYAAIKFFLYTLVGSMAMLIGILMLYFNTSPHTLNMLDIATQHPLGGKFALGALTFWLMFIAFAIKVPTFPFHTWLPLAHVEAPTAGSVILAGILLKMGTYGFLRVVLPMLPEASATFAFPVAILAFISIVYGAYCALAQTDLKKLVAYSSVNHMGYVMLGTVAAFAATPAGNDITQKVINFKAAALNGAVMQMVSHGLITGALFFLVGVIYERAHTRDLNSFGGLGATVPVYAGFFILFALASLGLPGLCGFVGEFLVFVGAYGVGPFATGLFIPLQIIVALSLLGVILT